MVVAYQNQIVMDETLDRALERLFGRGAPGEPFAPPSTLMTDVAPEASPADTAATLPAPSTTLAQQAQGYYSRALQARREGNWALYGEEIERLGEVLEQLPGTNRQN